MWGWGVPGGLLQTIVGAGGDSIHGPQRISVVSISQTQHPQGRPRGPTLLCSLHVCQQLRPVRQELPERHLQCHLNCSGPAQMQHPQLCYERLAEPQPDMLPNGEMHMEKNMSWFGICLTGKCGNRQDSGPEALGSLLWKPILGLPTFMAMSRAPLATLQFDVRRLCMFQTVLLLVEHPSRPTAQA